LDLRSGKYDFDLAQRKHENDKKANKRNDLTLEIKERIKEYLHQELSPEQIVVLFKTDCHVCPQSLFINIFGR
jgi:IS30 family transposase